MASGQWRMRSSEGGRDIGVGGRRGCLPGGRAGRRVIRRMTRVSHDSAPLPPPPVSVCQGREPPLATTTAAFPPHFYLYIYFLSSLSLPLLPLLLLLFHVSLCVYQMSSFYMTAGLPPHTPGPRCGRSKGGGRSLSVVNFNFCAHCRYFHAPAPNPPTFLLCV